MYRKKCIPWVLATALLFSCAGTSVYAAEGTSGGVTSWKELYERLGVDTSESGTGYYDAITSATKFGSYHAKDIPTVVNKATATVDGEEQTVLDGVVLSGKDETVKPVLASASYTDSSKYGTDEFVIVPDDTADGYVWNDYIANLYAATISDGTTTVGAMPWIDYYGESATSGPHYNKVQISLNSGTSVGSNQAAVHRYDAFYNEAGNLNPGTYTVVLYAEGFEPLTAGIVVPEYEYMYAALSWGEYWANEGVMAAGSTESSENVDSRSEADLGAFDAVSRATTVHGVHRGSYQCSATIYDTNGATYELSHWSSDGKTMYFADGTSAGWDKGTLTFADHSTATMDHYTVNGFKYIPVRIAKEDAADFCKNYRTVANGEKLMGGYGEVNLSAYELVAAVDKTTNGLKTITKNADGTYSFSAATQGNGSGIAGEAQKSVDMSQLTVTVKEASGTYGEFLRVDLTGNEYGALGAKMNAVTWKYYGSTDPSTNMRARALATYGTKFAADNWMHKSNGIQLGLTESARCQLPDGYDGTGYWQIVVGAMGYANTTINFSVTEDNIVKSQPQEQQQPQAITTSASSYSKKYGEKAFSLDAKTDGDGTLSFRSSNEKVVSVDENGLVTINGVGTANIVISASETTKYDDAEASVTVTVGKATNPMKVSATSKKYKVSKLKRKSASFKIGVSKAAGKVTYKSSSKKVKVTSKGVVTLKKGTKKGTYKITISAAGNENYAAATKKFTISVK